MVNQLTFSDLQEKSDFIVIKDFREEISVKLTDIIKVKIAYDILGKYEIFVFYKKRIFYNSSVTFSQNIGNIDLSTYMLLESRKHEFPYIIINKLNQTKYRKNITSTLGFIRRTYNQEYLIPYALIENIVQMKKGVWNHKQKTLTTGKNTWYIVGNFFGKGIEKVRISQTEFNLLKQKGIYDKIKKDENV